MKWKAGVMHMNKNYALYLFKRWKPGWLFYAVMYVMIPAACILLDGSNYYLNQGEAVRDSLHTAFAVSAGIAIVSCFILPVFMFSYLHRKRSEDLFLCLPISRAQQIRTEFFIMYAAVMGGFIASALVSLLCGIFTYPGLIHAAGQMAALTAHMALFTGVMLLFNSLLYMTANNILDGVVMLGAYTLLPFIMQFVVKVFLQDVTVGSAQFYSSTFFERWLSPLYLGTANANILIDPDMIGISDINAWSWISEAVLLAYGILAFILNQRQLVRRKAERAEQLSDSPLAYPFVIHIMLFLGLLLISSSYHQEGFTASFIFVLVMLCLYAAGSFIYRRRIIIRPRLFIIFAILCLLTGALSEIGWKTKGFGLIYPVNLSADSDVEINYDAYMSKKDLGDASAPDEYVSVYFDAVMTYDQWQNNKDFQDIFNRHMEESITALYQEKTAYFSSSALAIYNTSTVADGSTRMTNYHRYPLPEDHMLTLDELMTVSQFTKVNIATDDGENTYTLQAYLQKEGK